MQIGEIMTKEVDRVTPDTPIEVAARISMQQRYVVQYSTGVLTMCC